MRDVTVITFCDVQDGSGLTDTEPGAKPNARCACAGCLGGADSVAGGWVGCFDLGDGPPVFTTYFEVDGNQVLASAAIRRDNKGGCSNQPLART